MSTTEQISDLLAQVIRVGFVTARDPATLRVRVECKDTVTAALVSDWLQVLVPRAKDDRQYDLPDVGEQVLCLFLPHGREKGFVLGSMFAEIKPPVTNGDKTHREFKDGTTLEYDRAAHKLVLKVKGDINVELTGNLTIKADQNITVKAGGILKMNAAHISMQE